MLRRIHSLSRELLLGLFYSKQNKIFTHLTSSEKIKLLSLAKRCGGCYLEVGSYLGASSCFIAEGIRKSKKHGRLYCVDTWQNDAMSEGKRNTFQDFLTNTNEYKDLIVPLCGRSVDVAKEFNQLIDFLFIDGDHSYEGVKADVDAWFPKLNDGALVIFHDIGWAEGVQKVVREEVSPNARKEGYLSNLYWAWLKWSSYR